MLICVHWSTDPSRFHFEHLRLYFEPLRSSIPPFWASTAPELTLMRIRIRILTLMLIRIGLLALMQISKFYGSMRIWIRNTSFLFFLPRFLDLESSYSIRILLQSVDLDWAQEVTHHVILKFFLFLVLQRTYLLLDAMRLALHVEGYRPGHVRASLLLVIMLRYPFLTVAVAFHLELASFCFPYCGVLHFSYVIIISVSYFWALLVPNPLKRTPTFSQRKKSKFFPLWLALLAFHISLQK